MASHQNYSINLALQQLSEHKQAHRYHQGILNDRYCTHRQVDEPMKAHIILRLLTTLCKTLEY